MPFAYTERDSGLAPDAFQTVFDFAPNPLVLVAPGTPAPVLMAANEAFLQLMALARPAVEGRRIDSVFRAAAAHQVRQAVEQCFTDGEPARLRIVHAPASQVVRMEVEVRRISVAGTPHVILGLSTLERRLTLAELGEAGVLAELGALSRGLVYIHDVPRDRLRYGRHPLVARLGLPSSPVSLEQIRAMVHPGDVERWSEFLAEQSSAPDDRVSKATFRMIGADGQVMWVNVRTRVFARDSDGEIHRVIGVAADVTESHLHAAAMATAADALAHAEVNERRRIGRELHDSTSQLLVAAQLGINALERRCGTPADCAPALEEVRGVITRAQAEMRNFAYMLHPPSLQSEGLERCLRDFAAGFGKRTGLTIGVKVGRGLGRLPNRVELALYRIAQEALMNVYRHAEAEKVSVRLQSHEGQAVLEVEDDGVGLAVASAGTPGVGISGMEARMIQLGGAFALEAGEKGVLVRASAPIQPQVDA